MFFNIFPFNDISFYDKHYDPSANLLCLDAVQLNNFFDFIYNLEKTHPIEYSIEYATMLLKRNQPGDVKRAHDILNTALTFQDTNKQHKTFGTIAVYAEAPITENFSQEFDLPNNGMICIVLLQILDYFSHLLSDELINKIKMTCFNVAFFMSLTSHSDRLPICCSKLLYIYILLKCGKLSNNTDFSTFATILFDNFYSGICYNNGFWEYNSTYETYYISELLAMIRNNISNPNQIGMVDTLYDILWKNIAENFHSSMKLLTGPQSDISKELPPEQFYTFIKIALGETSGIPETWVPVLSRCPNKYRFHFYAKQSDKFIQQLVSHGSTSFCFYNSKIATNYIKPNYTIGSFNCCEFWSHHKPVIGYFTSKDNSHNFKFGIKVLMNGRDFSSGKLNSVQHRGSILGHISFLTNRGAQHLSLTTTNGKINTNDFRIRFFVEGNIKKLHVLCSNQSLKILYGDTVINYTVPFIKIDDLPVHFKLNTKKDRLYFDAIIVEEDQKREINLMELSTAICQFVLQIASADEELSDSSYSLSEGNLTGTLFTTGYELKVVSQCKPDYYEYINSKDKQYINDTLFSSHTTFNSFQTSLYNFMASSKENYNNLSFDPIEYTLNELENIASVETNNLHDFILKLLNEISLKNYTLGIFKRYAVQIVKALFNNAVERNFKLETIINNSFFDIYQRISNSPSHSTVYEIILDTTDNIEKELLFIEHQSKKQDIVSNMISIIEKNYNDPQLSLTSISEILGVSESYISRVFKKKTNASYVKYLTRVRMEKAKKLLIDGTSVNEIISLCGYTNTPSFNSAFKRYTGSTVRTWLEQNKIKI